MKDTATPLGIVSFDAVIETNLSEVVVAYRSPGSALPYPVLKATFEGAEAPSVAVIESDAQYVKLQMVRMWKFWPFQQMQNRAAKF